jgi:outer membrane protein TolC
MVFGRKSFGVFSAGYLLFATLPVFAQSNLPEVRVDRKLPQATTTGVISPGVVTAKPKQLLPGSLFDGRSGASAQLDVSRNIPAFNGTSGLAVTPLDLTLPPLGGMQIPGESPQLQRITLQKAARIERLRQILGADALLLPPPPKKGPVFSAKLVEKLGIEDAAAASISQNFQLAAAESRQAQAEAMTGVARGALLPQVKFSMKQGRETTTPAGDTYKYCKTEAGCRPSGTDANGNPLPVKYGFGKPVPASSILNGGIASDQLSDESFAYNDVTMDREERMLTATQSLFDYGAWSEVARLNRMRDAAEYGAKGARLKSVLDASGSFLRLFQNSLALRFAEDYEGALMTLYSRIEDRVAAGASSQADQERVKGRRVNARSTVLDAKNALEVELTGFQKITGFRPQRLMLPPDWILPVPEDIDLAVEAASQSNPALMADLKQAEATLAELKKAKGAFLPQVALEFSDSITKGTGGTRVPIVTSDGPNWVLDADGKPTAEYNSGSSKGEKPNYEKRIVSLMLTMNWSLFSGGADFYQHRAIAEKYNEAMFRLLDTRRELEEKLRASFESLATTALRTQEIAKEMEANQQVVESFTEQMFVANRSLLDVLDAHQKLYQSRLDYLRLLIAEANLAYDVLYNIGTLTDALRVPANAQSPRGRMGSLVGQDVWGKK